MHLAPALATFLVGVRLVERVGGFILFQVALEDLATGLDCELVHREVSGAEAEESGRRAVAKRLL